MSKTKLRLLSLEAVSSGMAMNTPCPGYATQGGCAHTMSLNVRPQNPWFDMHRSCTINDAHMRALHAGIGDVNMAYQALQTALSMDETHAEALTNLAVLEVRQGNDSNALVHFQLAQQVAPHAYEAWYNGALVSMRKGNLEDCYKQARCALEAFPDHSDTKDLLKQMQQQFNAL